MKTPHKDDFNIEYELVFSPQAEQQLYEILMYLSEHAGSFIANKLLQRIFDNIEHLKHYPKLGRMRDDLNVREIFPENYRVVYEINEDLNQIQIITIIHSRMLYPRPH